MSRCSPLRIRYRPLASFCLAMALLVVGCTPRVQGLGPEIGSPRLEADAFVAADGQRLPVSSWPAPGSPRAVIVALHGYNMYRNYFAEPAAWWAAQELTVYAMDQRGFGGGPKPGIWGGGEAMAADARGMLAAVRARHPGVPLYLVGVSMGAAVALKSLAGADERLLDGAVLIAPAVWGGEALHPLLRAGMWLTAHLTPWNRATGGGLRRRPTDNIDYLYRLGDDPLVIRYSRIDSVYGLSQLMGQGLAAAPEVTTPLLVLYGANDEIIPRRPVELMLARLRAPHRYVEYQNGWHMLLHDKQAEQVWRDIAAWIANPKAPLPSGAPGTLTSLTLPR